jgi:hypothetical protein
LPGAIQRGASSSPRQENISQSGELYDGRERIGTIICRDHRYLAVDRLGRPLGTYDTAVEAACAIGDAAAPGAAA